MGRNNFSILTILSVTLLLTLSLSFSTYSPTDRCLLVLLDDLSLKSSHSVFFNSFKSRGFDFDFKLADDPKLALQRYGQYFI
uniref:Dolichyl-diphosphooligosaccharide--protein glycosyltransferase 48 kDa subunit n=1 Tax=Populus trichocarpa TaxID=3694 RepID=A0A2K2ATW5_POPTR